MVSKIDQDIENNIKRMQVEGKKTLGEISDLEFQSFKELCLETIELQLKRLKSRKRLRSVYRFRNG